MRIRLSDIASFASQLMLKDGVVVAKGHARFAHSTMFTSVPRTDIGKLRILSRIAPDDKRICRKHKDFNNETGLCYELPRYPDTLLTRTYVDRVRALSQ